MKKESVEHGADWDFQIGQRVRVIEGFIGRVTDVLDGPVSGGEVYIVTLDGGMGGGEYSASELTPDSGVRASTLAERDLDRYEANQAMLDMRMASDDYPELADILVERPPLENTAALTVTGPRFDRAGLGEIESTGSLRHGERSWPPSTSDMRKSLREIKEKRKRDWIDAQSGGVASMRVAYQMAHRPDESGPAINSLDDGTMLPLDVYDNPQFYTGFTSGDIFRDISSTLRQVRGKPDSTPITIYRSAPEGSGINPGDWVTISEAYARLHMDSSGDASSDVVYKKVVPASHVLFAGNDLAEWGYFPQGRAAYGSFAITDADGNIIDTTDNGFAAADLAKEVGGVVESITDQNQYRGWDGDGDIEGGPMSSFAASRHQVAVGIDWDNESLDPTPVTNAIEQRGALISYRSEAGVNSAGREITTHYWTFDSGIYRNTEVNGLVYNAGFISHIENTAALETPVRIQSGIFDRVMERVVDSIDSRLPERNKWNPNGNRTIDWCRFRRNERCFYPKELNHEATVREGYSVWVPHDRGRCHRVTHKLQEECGMAEPGPNSGDPRALIDATVPYEQGGQRGGIPTIAAEQRVASNIIATALQDPEFRFHVTSAWSDVRAKAKRIRSEGGIHIISNSGPYLVAEVQGDTQVYQTTIIRHSGLSVDMWECGCKWAQYSWGRSGRWKRYEGRMCSHALALTYEAQSQEWMGGRIKTDTTRPSWRKAPSKVGRNRPVPQRTASQVTPDDLPEIASWYINSAKSVEPSVTRRLKELAERYGGKMEGIQYRFKDFDSLLRKLNDKLRARTPGDPKSWVTDALRYTMVFFPADYSNSVQKVLYGIEESGWRITEEENTWAPGDSYSALHYIFVTQNGTPVELQFHTGESFELKNKTLHKLYEEFRDSRTPLRRRQELFDRMTAFWDEIEIPKDVMNFPELKRYHRPAHLLTSKIHPVLIHPELARPLIAEIRTTAAVPVKWRNRVTQLLSVLPGGMVRLQGDVVVPASEVMHPMWDPRAWLTASLRDAAVTGPLDGYDDQGGYVDPAGMADMPWAEETWEEDLFGEAILHDEPEPALPEALGTEALSRTAAKVYLPHEQDEIINEGEGVTASNLDQLDIAGTHYEALEQQDDGLW